MYAHVNYTALGCLPACSQPTHPLHRHTPAAKEAGMVQETTRRLTKIENPEGLVGGYFKSYEAFDAVYGLDVSLARGGGRMQELRARYWLSLSPLSLLSHTHTHVYTHPCARAAGLHRRQKHL